MSAFGVEHLAKADKRTKEAGAAVGGVVAANEGRAIYANKKVGRLGQQASSTPHKGSFRNIKGISDAPLGSHFSQSTHPEGVYNISTNALARARQKPLARKGQDQLRDTLKTKGFDRPVHMKIFSDGKARIWDGHHRTTRAAELGVKKIPVSVTHVNKPMPKPKSLFEAGTELRHHTYRRGLMTASKLIKRGEAMQSAFGVEHHDPSTIEKGLLGAGEGVARGFKAGVTGAAKAPKAAKMLAPTGAKNAFGAGKFVRTNAKPLAIGAGAGLGTGAMLGSKKSY